MSSCSSQVIFVLIDLSSAPHLCMVLPATLFSFPVYSWGDLTHVWVFLSLKKKKKFLFKNWNIVDIQYYVTFRRTTSWYDICIHYEMMTTLCLVTVSPHMKLLTVLLIIFLTLYIYVPMAHLSYLSVLSWRCAANFCLRCDPETFKSPDLNSPQVGTKVTPSAQEQHPFDWNPRT